MSSTSKENTVLLDENASDNNLKFPSVASSFTDDSDSEKCKSSEESIETSESESELTDEENNVQEYEAISNWGSFGVNEKMWCDKYRPVVRVTRYKDFVLTEEEKLGYLTDRIVHSCSSYLTKCPHFAKYVLGKCVLKNKRLENIEILKYFSYLQYLDLSWNKLTDVSVLKHLPLLMYLDVSHNELKELLNFRPPYNLIFVNYSYNYISKISDLSGFWTLKSLNISHNQIEVIENLQALKYLETLNLSFNKITQITNLENLNIINLYLQNNQISSFTQDKGFKTMPYLTYVRLETNELTNLNVFEEAVFLQSINVQENNISNLIEISSLKNLNFLRSVNLSKNPIQNHENYEAVCLTTIKNLQLLDCEQVDLNKKALFHPSQKYKQKMQAAQDHANFLSLSHLTKLPHLGINVIPSEQPPRPLIVLVSPTGSREDSLIKYFVRKHSKHITKLTNHTDREQFSNEPDDNHHFISPQKFNELLEQGEFLMMYSILNDNYGLSQEEYARAVQEIGKVMITQADLNAALALRLRGFLPFLVLAMPKSAEIHKQWLMETYGTQVFNIRYPEAAIKILKRDNSNTQLSITETESTFSDNHFPITKDEITDVDNYHRFIRRFSGLNENISSSNTIHDVFATQSSFKDSDYDETNFPENYICDIENKMCYSPENYELTPEGSGVRFSEELIEHFYSEVLKSRDLYVEFHRENPGVFYDFIYTDDMENALKNLKKVAKIATEKLSERIESKLDHECVNMCKNIVNHRLQIFETDIENGMIRNVNCTK